MKEPITIEPPEPREFACFDDNPNNNGWRDLDEEEIIGCDNEEDFIRCCDCDGHDACEDFGCAIKQGIIDNNL